MAAHYYYARQERRYRIDGGKASRLAMMAPLKKHPIAADKWRRSLAESRLACRVVDENHQIKYKPEPVATAFPMALVYVLDARKAQGR